MKKQEPDVKQKRPYDASRRQEQARLTAARIVEVAERRFLTDGLGTTLASIAAEAGVSADTLYKSFGGRAGLLRAIRQRALLGDGSAPAEQRSNALHGRDSDPREILRGWGTLTAEVMPRVAPILLLIRSAAGTDARVGELQAEMDEDRYRRMSENAHRLAESGHLRAGVTAQNAADVLWTYSSPELYELLVLKRGWSAERYGTFIADGIAAQLL
ncbi:MAG: TetR/AcrR family transcriptional regulator [Solirubrobacterales bacterium]|nr:TetR/AcrR family transcriptional regulator [Solirubrobacterales bacterium]